MRGCTYCRRYGAVSKVIQLSSRVRLILDRSAVVGMYLLILRSLAENRLPETEIAPNKLGDSLIPSKPFLSLPCCPRLSLEFAHVLEQPMP